jgi:hypothetical protein
LIFSRRSRLILWHSQLWHRVGEYSGFRVEIKKDCEGVCASETSASVQFQSTIGYVEPTDLSLLLSLQTDAGKERAVQAAESHLAPRMRMCGFTPLPPKQLFVTCCLIKHKENFTFNFNPVYIGKFYVIRI